MSRVQKVSALLLLLLGWGAACGDGGGPDPNVSLPIASMLIRNKSQFVLDELRIHPGTQRYLEVANVLEERMPIDGELLYYGTGEVNFTFLRERYQDGPVLAYTTAEPIPMFRGEAYLLSIFDESFRIEDSQYVRADEYPGLIVGDPGPPCEWLPKTETGTTCPNMPAERDE